MKHENEIHSLHKKSEDVEIEEFESKGDSFGEPQFTEDDIRKVMQELSLSNEGPLFSLICSENPLAILSEMNKIIMKNRTIVPKEASILVAKLAISVYGMLKNSEKASRCSICMDVPINPSVSTLCWHVHCTKCWLKTLSVKRLCPQCLTITQPEDIRRVYI